MRGHKTTANKADPNHLTSTISNSYKDPGTLWVYLTNRSPNSPSKVPFKGPFLVFHQNKKALKSLTLSAFN